MPTTKNKDSLQTKLTGLFAQQRVRDSEFSQERLRKLFYQLLRQSYLQDDLQEHSQSLANHLANYYWHLGKNMLEPNSLSQIAACLYYHLCRWRPNKGRVGREFLQLVEQFNELFKSQTTPTAADLITFRDSLVQYDKKLNTRSIALEHRQLTGDLNQSTAEQTRIELADTINTLFANRQLPRWLTEFIHQKLFFDLTALTLNQNESHTVERWIDLLRQLAWVYEMPSLSPQESLHHQQKLYTFLPEVIEKIDESYYASFPDTNIYEYHLEKLIESLVNCLKKQVEDTEPFLPINQQSTDSTIVVANSPDIKAQAQYQPGDWFFLKHAHDPIAAYKIYFFDEQSGVAYFSDYYGKRSASYDSEQVAFFIASKVLVKIKSFETQLLHIVDFFIDQEQKYWARKSAAPIESPVRKEKPTESPHHQPADEINQSVKKIKQEIDELEQRLVKKQATSSETNLATPGETQNSPPIKQTVKSDEEIQAFGLLLNNLQLGAWLRFVESTEPRQKLTLKLPSSDKYLFTDRLGRKMGEYKLADLKTLFSQGLLEVVSEGEQFDNKLEQIVRGQRR